jgi:hypothetical protein
LPETFDHPVPFHALEDEINKAMTSAGHACQIKEISPGLRRHIAFRFDAPLSQEMRALAKDIVCRRLALHKDSTTTVERPTISTLKFSNVPLYLPTGRDFTVEHAKSSIRANPSWKEVEMAEEPRFVLPKGATDPIAATLLVKVKDVRKASVARSLLFTSVTFAGAVRRCREWTNSPVARQCSTCLAWGHTAFNCRSPQARCNMCAGIHSSMLHEVHVSKCTTPGCKHAQTLCLNCGGGHVSSSVACPFFKARSSPEQLQKLFDEKRQRFLFSANQKVSRRSQKRARKDAHQGLDAYDIIY